MLISKRGSLGTVLCMCPGTQFCKHLHMCLWEVQTGQQRLLRSLLSSTCIDLCKIEAWLSQGQILALKQVAGKILEFIQVYQGERPRWAGGIWCVETLLLSQELDN